jgi:N-acyl-D-aspartate/D-glutamate deacylase
MADRGMIESGMAADLVLFDAAKINDRATISDPHATSVGVKTVWVNGEVVYEDAKTAGAFPGGVVRRRVVEQQPPRGR